MIAELEALRPQIAALCSRFQVRRLDVFGSAVSAQRFAPEHSDVDFLVAFNAPSPGTYADQFFGLQEALSALLHRPVDLVVERAIRNPYFRQSVQATRELLYAA
jgi:predicted nucleotidyltransferase